jgi:hypothetical protein
MCYAIEPRLIEIELTEASMMKNGDKAVAELRAIQQMDVKVLVADVRGSASWASWRSFRCVATPNSRASPGSFDYADLSILCGVQGMMVY